MKSLTFQQRFVFTAITRGERTFQAIVQSSGGMDPLELQVILDDLIFSGRIQLMRGEYRSMCDGASSVGKEADIPSSPELPRPHPLDYDWRFHPRTVRYLAQQVFQETLARETVLFFGVPSVFAYLLSMRPSQSMALLDGNRALIDAFGQIQLPETCQAIHHDLLADQLWQTEARVGAILMDPPWYPEYYRAFLLQAANVAQIGTRVYVSVLPINTRAGAPEDRWEILQSAHQLGLQVLSVQEGVLSYETPDFERATFRIASVPHPENWRSGDLVTFVKGREPEKQARDAILLTLQEPGKCQRWEEVLLGLHKIKIKGPFDDYSEKPELLSVEENDMLSTVSRRYMKRERIDLWLWDNQVFALRGHAAFFAALLALAGKPSEEDFLHVPAEHVRQAIHLLVTKTHVGDSLQEKDWMGRDCERKRSILGVTISCGRA